MVSSVSTFWLMQFMFVDCLSFSSNDLNHLRNLRSYPNFVYFISKPLFQEWNKENNWFTLYYLCLVLINAVRDRKSLPQSWKLCGAGNTYVKRITLTGVLNPVRVEN